MSSGLGSYHSQTTFTLKNQAENGVSQKHKGGHLDVAGNEEHDKEQQNAHLGGLVREILLARRNVRN